MFRPMQYLSDLIFIRENRDFCLDLYKKMLIARNLENVLSATGFKEHLKQPLYLSRGQEACGVGIAAAASRHDNILLNGLNYRSMPFAVSRGLDLKKYVKTIFFSSAEGSYEGLFTNGFAPSSDSIGANFAIAVGQALAIQQLKNQKVMICVFGDGTASRGTFHSALNISKLWNLPVLWICEVNQYSISTPLNKLLAQKNVFKTAENYGIPSKQVDGNNVISVWRATLGFIGKIKTDGGPSFLEMRTFRQRGHTHDDSDNYRPANEKRAWELRDPIDLMKNAMIFSRVIKIDRLKKVEEDAKEFVKKTIKSI